MMNKMNVSGAECLLHRDSELQCFEVQTSSFIHIIANIERHLKYTFIQEYLVCEYEEGKYMNNRMILKYKCYIYTIIYMQL